MRWIGSVEVAVVCLWLVALALKIARRRRRGIPSFVFPADASVVQRSVTSAMTGAMFVWLFLVLLHGVRPDYALFQPVLFRSPLLAGVGVVLAIAGLGVGIAGLWTLGSAWRIGAEPDPEEKLVTRGIFAVSRNPIYLFFDLLAVAMVLTSGSLFFVVTAPLILVGGHLQILDEEKLLEKTFGERFEPYRRRVHRYLGRGASPN